MIVKDTKTGETREIEADEEDGTFGIFVFVGFDPKSQLFEGKLEMENRYIVTDKYMHTSVPGVFAAGDVIVKHLRQVSYCLRRWRCCSYRSSALRRKPG